MSVVFLLVASVINNCNGIIYTLNDTVLGTFPNQYKIDDYDKCFHDPGGVYCTFEAALVSDAKHELLDIMHEYSQHTSKHYNHSYLTYGICISQIYQNFTHLNVLDQKRNLEGYINRSLWDEYRLKSNVYNNPYCINNDEFKEDSSDQIFKALFILILSLNAFGTFFDLFFNQESNILKCFSLRQNWIQLVTISDRNDSKKSRLKCLDGIRTNLLILLFVGHASFIFANVSNTSSIEKAFNVLPVQFLTNMPLTMSCFFLISSLLLSYNLQDSEKDNWAPMEITRRIMKRWCRFTPTYAIVLLYIATWMRHYGSGPFWMYIYNNRIKPCRSVGLYNMLYVNNFIDESMCMLQTWYIAAEMQLHLLGLVVCILFKGRWRKIILAAMFVAGLIIPAYLTYKHDLDMQLTVSIELIRSYFLSDPTFRLVYRHSYTNVSCYAMGLSFGLVLHKLQKTNFDIMKYKKYAYLYYSALLLNAGVMYLGTISYWDEPRLPLLVRMVLAAVMKPLLAAGTAVIIFGAVFKLEDNIRGYLEWRGWTVLYKLCYCAYLLHLPLIDYLIGTGNLLRINYILMFVLYLGVVATSFFLALLLWLLVENPFAHITDNLFRTCKPCYKEK